MTLKAFIAQARKLSLLNGEMCVRASPGAYDWALLLTFGMLYPPDATGYREWGKGIVVECPWRLETQTEVIVGSGNTDGTIREKIQACVGRRAIETEVHLPSYTACICFDEGLTLWIFPDDSRDYALQSDHPSSPWYLVGRAIPPGWEE